MNLKKLSLYLAPHILWFIGAGIFVFGILLCPLIPSPDPTPAIVAKETMRLQLGKQIMISGTTLFLIGFIGTVLQMVYLLKKKDQLTQETAPDNH